MAAHPKPYNLLAPEEWAGLSGRNEPVRLPTGTTVSSPEMAEPPFMGVIIEGELGAFLPSGPNEIKKVGVLGKEEVFWGSAAFERGNEGFTLKTTEPTKLLLFNEAQYQRLTREHPRLGVVLAEQYGRRALKSALRFEREKQKELLRRQLQQGLESYAEAPLIATSGPMRKIAERVEELAATGGPVLIEGEYGTGKQLLALRIHGRQGKDFSTFIPLDCAQLDAENWRETLAGSEDGVVGLVELAEGGTLFMKNVDAMPIKLQAEVGNFLSARLQPATPDGAAAAAPGPRLMASARDLFSVGLERGAIAPELAALFAAEQIELPPLRERKKEIPALVEYFVAKFAASANRHIDGVTPDALRLLLGHDYRSSNILELERAIERAVVLTRDHQIWPRHLFLGAPAEEPDEWRYNLLRIPRFKFLVHSRIYPGWLQAATSVAFLAIVAVCLWGPQTADNTGLVLVWGVWWPAMFLSFYLLGRSWCSVCAYSALGRLAKKLGGLEIRLPALLRDNGDYIMAGAFLAVLWIEEITAMHSSPRATGILMISMMSMAVASAYVFRRESWCRYLCPLGGMIGVCSMTSLIEVRADQNVCLNKCKTSSCYNGTATVGGCPTFEHLAFVDNNQTCKLCYQCVRSCPFSNVSVNLRLPGREIWLLSRVRDKMSYFVAVLVGAALPALYLQNHSLALESLRDKAIYTGAHFALPLAVAAAWWVINLLSPLKGITAGGENGGEERWRRMWMTAYAYAPLAVALHMAYRLRHVLGAEGMELTVAGAGAQVWRSPMMVPFQLGALAAGLVFSLYVLHRVRVNRSGKDFNAPFHYWLMHELLMVLLAAAPAVWAAVNA